MFLFFSYLLESHIHFFLSYTIFITYIYYISMILIYLLLISTHICLLQNKKRIFFFESFSFVVAVLFESSNRIKLSVNYRCAFGSGSTVPTAATWLCHRFRDERCTCNNVVYPTILCCLCQEYVA